MSRKPNSNADAYYQKRALDTGLGPWYKITTQQHINLDVHRGGFTVPKKPAWPSLAKDPKEYHTHNLRQVIDKSQRYLSSVETTTSESNYKRLVDQMKPYETEFEIRKKIKEKVSSTV